MLRPVRHLALAALAALSGCGGAPAPAPRTGAPAGPVLEVASDDGRTLVLDGPAAKVLPANATALDLVLAVAGRERVAAVSPESVAFSHEAARLSGWDESGLLRPGRHGLEAVLAAEPDLVVDADWQDAGVRRALLAAGVPVLTLRTPVAEPELWSALERVGAVLGEQERAAALVAELRRRVERARARGAARGERVLFYSNLGSGGGSQGRGTTGDLVLALAGLANAAGALEGHASCDHELLVTLDPDWIAVGSSAAGDNPTVQHLLGTPALSGLRAVRGGRIVELERTLWSSASHCLVEAAETLLDAMDRVEATDDDPR